MASNARRPKSTTKKSGVTSHSTSSRSRGRPPRLSREDIINASLQLLEAESLEAFTLAKVANRLNTVSMALYNYFDSREALLCAVADKICMDFRMPRTSTNQPWQKKLHAWLSAVRRLAEKHPIILKISGVDGQTTAGWLRVTLAVSRTLYDEGMRGKELAINSYLFCSQAIALIMFETVGAEFHSSLSLGHLDELDPAEQEFLRALRPFHIKLTTDEILKAGFQQMIDELELKLGT